MTAPSDVRRPVPALPAVRRPSLARLILVEAHKTLDTRAGVVLVAVTGVLGLIVTGFELATADDGVPLQFSELLAVSLFGAQLLLPLIAILVLTSEWSRRTALTTFALVPRRGRVLAAKLVAAPAVGIAVALAVVGLCAALASVGGAVTGTPVEWDASVQQVAGPVLVSGLNVLLGAAFGVLLLHTAPAISVYYLSQILGGTVSALVLGDDNRWLDINLALQQLASFELSGQGPQVATALTVWIVLPIAVGAWRWVRQDVS